MKKVFSTTTIVLALFAVTLDSCKKGEEDPFMSFHSRKGRVCGDWKASAGTMTEINGSATKTYTYADPTMTITQSGTSSTITYSMTMSFEKDGTFKSVVDQSTTGYHDVLTQSGTWNFGGRVGDVKNKEQIFTNLTEEVDVETIGTTTTTTTTTYTGNDNGTTVWNIVECKNKEMKVHQESSSTVTGVKNSTVSDWTLVQ